MAHATPVSSGRPYDHLFKILLVGNSGVGKSSVLLRYVDGNFEEDQLSTIGVDFRVKFMNIEKKCIKLAFWDTAGQERFRTITSNYYRGAHGMVLMYDVTDVESFSNLKMWLAEISKNSAHPDAVLVLLGNKIDKRTSNENGNPVITTKQGMEFAAAHSMLFVETSAKTNEGIEYAFKELVYKIMESPSLTNGGVHGRAAEGAGDSPLRLDDPRLESPGEASGICGC